VAAFFIPPARQLQGDSMVRVNITEDALERKLGRTARCVTMTFSRAQTRALLNLISHSDGPHSDLIERIREKSAYHRVTLDHDEAMLLLTLALEAKRRSYPATLATLQTLAESPPP
jgi:hypothetical protein